MKCQKCGKNDVNFCYSSNVNGAVTKTHLCSECAQGAGYDIGSLFSRDMLGFGDMFDGVMPMIGRSGFADGLIPRLISQGGMNRPQFAVIPENQLAAQNIKCDCGSSSVARCDAKADDEMTERRRLNMEMRAAVEREDFEKAAELRDMIKGIEN